MMYSEICRINVHHWDVTLRYSKKAKALLLDTYHLSPPPSVVEIDTRLDGAYIQTILMRLTSRKTVPNIILNVSTRHHFYDVSLILVLTSPS